MKKISHSSKFIEQRLREALERGDRNVLLKGALSAPSAPVDARYFTTLRERTRLNMSKLKSVFKENTLHNAEELPDKT